MKVSVPLVILICTISLYADYSLALLAPYYQDMKEIQAIFEDKTITEKAGMGARAIQSISKVQINDKKGWRLVLGPQGECSLVINVDYKSTLKEGFVGPAVFELEAEDLVCQTPSKSVIMNQAPSGMLPKLEDTD